ncbi:MAG: hypothetical protein ACKV2O_16835 [Acidimicrobiales bacterium]
MKRWTSPAFPSARPRVTRALLVLSLLAGMVAAVVAPPAGAQSTSDPNGSLGAAATLFPYKTVSLPTTDAITDVEQSAVDYPLVAAGRSLYVYGVSGLYITQLAFPTTIHNVARSGASVFVHEGTTVHHLDSTTLGSIAVYDGVANLADQPVVGDHLVFVDTSNQLSRVHLPSGTVESWSPPVGTTPVSIHGRSGQPRTVAVVNSAGTDRLIEYDNTTTPPTAVVDTTIPGATFMGVTADGGSALMRIGANALRRVPFPISVGLAGTDITGGFPAITGVSVTSGNGGWESVSTFDSSAGTASHFLVQSGAATPLHVATGGGFEAQDAAWGPLGGHLAVVRNMSPKGMLMLYTVGARPASTFSGSWGEYNGVTPWRALDTRNGTGATARRIGRGETVSIAVTGRDGVPAGNVASVAVNLTLVSPSTDTYLAAYPSGATPPPISSINSGPGQIRTNLAIVIVSSLGRITLYNAAGDTDIVVDVMGFFSSTNGVSGARYRTMSPTRMLDTRDTANPAGPSDLMAVPVRGRLGVPSNAISVAITLTAVDPTEGTFITAFPSDAAQPEASNLNPPAATVVANSAFVRIGADGNIALFNAVGTTHLLVDVVGYWIEDDTTEAGRYFNFARSFRHYDSRDPAQTPLPSATPMVLPVAGWPPEDPYIPLPPDGADAVVFNLTATEITHQTYLTAYPGWLGLNRPNTSSLNVAAGQTAAILTVSGYGNDGSVAFYNAVGTAHFIVDIAGFFSSSAF